MKRYRTLLYPVLASIIISTTLNGAFSDPNFIEETIYEGNGMISMDFDDAGQLYVTEKQGRLLVFKPNDLPQTVITYQYYEGSWTELPDFDSLTPVATGTLSEFSLEPSLLDDNFGFRYTTTITAPTSGDYTFYTRSDDGSRLLVNGVEVVNNDGLHGAVEASGTVTLSAAEHTIVVEFFEAGGGESLEVQWESATLPKQILGGASGDFLPPSVVLDITSDVNADAERGLLGLALDPDFTNNRYAYLFYSTNIDQRLVRYTIATDSTSVVANSKTILLSGLPNTTTVHNSGDIHFSPNDPYSIYIVQGDDGNRYIVDELDNYNGKILRVDAGTGEGLSDNPFWDGDSDSVRSRIWAHSFRNAFRFTFDPDYPVEDVLYISENGDGTDRLARIEKGGDGAWGTSDYLNSSDDGKRTVLRTTAPSVTAVKIIRGGPFAPDGPVIYQARHGKEIRRWDLSGIKLDTITPLAVDNNGPFLDNTTGFNIVSFTLGPDGALYYTDSNQGDSVGTGYNLGRIRYQGGEAPVAAFSIASNTSGEAPFTVNFTDESTSADAPLATWSWDFGDNNTSTQPSPQHTYTTPGVYTATLTVTNSDGLLDTTIADFFAYASIPLTITGNLRDARSAPVDLSTPIDLKLYQSDGSTPVTTSTGAGANSNTFNIPSGAVVNVSTTAQLTHSGLVVEIDDSGTPGFVPARKGFAINLDAGSQTINADFFLSDTAIHGQVHDTLNTPANTDIGISRGSNQAPYAILGGRDYPENNHTPPIGVDHRFDLDELGYYYFPIRSSDAGVDFQIDTTGDTNRNLYGIVSQSGTITSAEDAEINLSLGLYDGGTSEDDLSSISETLNVDFDNNIQPIFTSSCVACHNDIATNSGGLDLQPGASFAELVNRYSSEASGIKLVDPGSPERSYLMEKINSGKPQIGTRMRPNDPMPLANQALIRDWISQLTPYIVWSDTAFTGNTNIAPEEDYDGDGVANIIEFALNTDPVVADAAASPKAIAAAIDGSLAIHIPFPSDAITLHWEISSDLSPLSWTAIATRTARNNWSVTPDYAIATDPITSELILRIPAPTTGNETLFFRLKIEE
jgi:PKD repeat protein